MVIMNITKNRDKNISSDLCFMIKERSEKGNLTLPTIFIASYTKSPGSDLLIPQFTYGLMQRPISIYDCAAEDYKYIKLSTEDNHHLYKKNGGKWLRASGDIKIPADAKLVDVEKLFEASKINAIKAINEMTMPKDADLVTCVKKLLTILASDVNKVEIPSGENVLNLYFGNLADVMYDAIQDSY